MRPAAPRSLAFAFAFAFALVQPSALAAGFNVGERAAEATLGAARSATFRFPIQITEDGSLYAKILGTPGNAVFDGERSNGSWDVGFAIVRADTSREELGAFDNATSTRLVPVHDGDALTFEATLDAPVDALKGGAVQKVYVALAFRSPAAIGGGDAAASGASMDEARAFTLLVRVPDAWGAPAPAPSPSPVPGTVPTPGTPPVGEVPVAPSGASNAQANAGGPPAGPTAERALQLAPTWFYVAIVLMLGAIALSIGAIALNVTRIERELRVARQAAEVRVPVVDADEAAAKKARAPAAPPVHKRDER